MATSILKYCKPVRSSCPSSSSGLPEPNGLLSKEVPPKAIKLANTEVAKLKEQPRGKGSYLILTTVQLGKW